MKIDLVNKQVVGYLQLSGGGMPQDIRVSPDGKTFYAAEMTRSGVYTIDAATFTETGFIPTGTGAHGLYPSRDGKVLYVANRGSTRVGGPPGGAGQRVGASTGATATRSSPTGRCPGAAAPTWAV